ncbi:MAG: LysR family transcriptional regulator [Succinivibrio sp.]|nr:LysR family transcriptional regulator [Succinivibrio sp.]
MLKPLRYFVAIVECHSFTQAALRCYVSQSALSQQMKLLEHELRVELFVKKGRSFALTAAGERLYRGARQLLSSYDKLKNAVQDTARLQNSRLSLRVGYLNNFMFYSVQRCCTEFSRMHPEIQLQLFGGNHEELYTMIVSGRIDVALNDQRRRFSAAFNNVVLLETPCMAVLSDQHPLSVRSKVEIGELSELPCIVISREEHARDEYNHLRSVLGVVSEMLTAGNSDDARLMTSANQGYYISASDPDQPELLPGLRKLPLYIAGQRLRVNYCAFYPLASNNPAAALFADFAASYYMNLAARHPDYAPAASSS